MPNWPKKNKREGIDEYGRTPFWESCFKGDLAAVKKELASGFDPNVGDDQGYTPLQIAIQEKHKDVINLLLENGADINQVDKNGNSTMWTAVHNWRQDYDVILLLLNNGADPSIENNYGNSPLSVLQASDNEEVLKLIKNY